MDNKVDKGFEEWKKKMGYGDFSGIVYETQREAFSAGFKAGQEDRDREMEKCKQAAIRHGNMFDEFFNDVGTLLGIEKEVLELGDPQYIYETISKNTAEIEELKGTIRSQSRIDIAYQKEVSKLQAEIKLEQSNAKEAEKCATRLIDKLDKAVERNDNSKFKAGDEVWYIAERRVEDTAEKARLICFRIEDFGDSYYVNKIFKTKEQAEQFLKDCKGE